MNHDQNFKNLIVDYPVEALQLFAPSESADLSAAVSVTPIRQEQLKEHLLDGHRELDVPLLIEWPNGQREALLFALEHESQGSRFSIIRLAYYCQDLAKLCKTSRVVPVVVFLDRPSSAKQLKLGTELCTYLHFHYLACTLAKLPWQDFQHSNNLVARLNLPNMCYHKKDKVSVYACATQGLFSLETDHKKQAKYLDFIDMYAHLDNDEKRRYKQQYPQEANTVSQFADRFIAQGLEQGLEQGVEQGIQKGEAALLLRLIESRFGPVSSHVKTRIAAADADTILAWSEKIFAARKPEDLWH